MNNFFSKMCEITRNTSKMAKYAYFVGNGKNMRKKIIHVLPCVRMKKVLGFL